MLVDGLRPPPIPDDVRRRWPMSPVRPGPGDPTIDEAGGEPGLSGARIRLEHARGARAQVGQRRSPVNAILRRRLRAVSSGSSSAPIGGGSALASQHLGARALHRDRGRGRGRQRRDAPVPEASMGALGAASVEAPTTSQAAAILPNLGGTLPQRCLLRAARRRPSGFRTPTPAARSAADEHLLASVARKGLQIMTGLFWDLGEPEATQRRSRQLSARHSSRFARRVT